MFKYTETEDEITIVINKHCDTDDDYDGFMRLIKIGLITNPSSGMYNLCEGINNAINNAVIKPVDPKEKISKHWDEMFTKFTGACLDSMLKDGEFAELIANFYNTIGEALGPVSYAGFELRKYFKENKPDSVAYQDWVDDCIYYYENSGITE